MGEQVSLDDKAHLEPIAAEIIYHPVSGCGINELHLNFTLTFCQQPVAHPVFSSKVSGTAFVWVVFA